VVLEEDISRIRLGNAPANLSMIRSLAISFAGALRAIAILRYNSKRQKAPSQRAEGLLMVRGC